MEVVRAKYNDFSDSDKMPWLEDYNLAFDWDEDNYVTFRVAEEIKGQPIFDMHHFYFDAYHNDDLRLRYWSSQNEATNDIYTNKSTAIQFLDYQLIKKAMVFFMEAERLIHKDNEKYLKKEAKKALEAKNELKNQQNRINNYHVVKPFEKIEIEGINFTLKDRKEAAELLKICTDFDENEIYDTFEMTYIESDEDDHKSFFLVAEDEIIAEKINLETYPPDNEDCYILGYIFTKPIKINKYVEAYDMEFSPPIICLDHAVIGNLILSGNTHYFHKNLYSTTIYGEYNHGDLIVKGKTEADLIIADDFGMQFSEVTMVASISDDRDIKVMNDLSALDLDSAQEMNYLPGTHNAEHCIKDELIFNDNKKFRFKGGFCASNYQLQEGEEDFYTILRKGESLIDETKLSAKYNQFINNSFAITADLFKTNEALKALPINEIHNEYPNENYTHLNYFYQETDEFYILGYWNLWYHLSIAVCIHKSNQIENNSLNVFYWNKENNAVRYQYGSEMEENTYYKNICQKIFFEAIEILFKVKEESNILKKVFEKEEKHKNIVFQKPYETVSIQGQTFKVIDRNEAEMYLNQCTDFDEDEIYDAFNMFSIDGDEESMKNSFFLLAETEMELESLYLDTTIESIDVNELYILGYIFKEKLTIKKHLSAFDMDFSPPIICMADADIFSLYLSGSTHYFHQNLDAEFLHGHYNHGELYVKGKATINLIYADNFRMYFNKIVCWALVCDQYDVTAFDTVLNEKNEEINVRNLYLATHNLEEVLFDRFLYEDEYGFEIKHHGYVRENEYEETFVEFIEKGGSPVDYDKLNAINESVEVDFKSRLEKILQHPEIKSMNAEGILYKGPVDDQYYYMKRDGFFQIGKWFLRQHIVVYITHFYEGETWLNVNYYEDDNDTNKYTFETKLADGFITSLIAKRIFREAEKMILG